MGFQGYDGDGRIFAYTVPDFLDAARFQGDRSFENAAITLPFEERSKLIAYEDAAGGVVQTDGLHFDLERISEQVALLQQEFTNPSMFRGFPAYVQRSDGSRGTYLFYPASLPLPQSALQGNTPVMLIGTDADEVFGGMMQIPRERPEGMDLLIIGGGGLNGLNTTYAYAENDLVVDLNAGTITTPDYTPAGGGQPVNDIIRGISRVDLNFPSGNHTIIGTSGDNVFRVSAGEDTTVTIYGNGGINYYDTSLIQGSVIIDDPNPQSRLTNLDNILDTPERIELPPLEHLGDNRYGLLNDDGEVVLAFSYIEGDLVYLDPDTNRAVLTFKNFRDGMFGITGVTMAQETSFNIPGQEGVARETYATHPQPDDYTHRLPDAQVPGAVAMAGGPTGLMTTLVFGWRMFVEARKMARTANANTPEEERDTGTGR